jgi:hypothetical protein
LVSTLLEFCRQRQLLPVNPKFLPRVSSISLVSCHDIIKYPTIPQYANTGGVGFVA